MSLLELYALNTIYNLSLETEATLKSELLKGNIY